MLTVKLKMRIKLTKPRPPQPDFESLSDPKISARLSQEYSDIRDGTKRVNEEVTAFIRRLFQETQETPQETLKPNQAESSQTTKKSTDKETDKEKEKPNQAKQANCTTKSSQKSQKPTDIPIGPQKSRPKRKRRKPKVKAKIHESTLEELDEAETTHFLRTMFDERPATEARYDQMIVDVQQAMLVLPKKAAMRRSKRYQSEATQQLSTYEERERCKDANPKIAGQCDSAMLN